MKPRRIDLEELAAKAGFRGKHADYLIVAGDTVVIVEETSRAKIDDVRKLQETINAIRAGPLGSYLHPQSRTSKIVAVIHSPRRVDTMVAKLLASESRRNTVYRAASCSKHLAKILREHGVELKHVKH